MTKVQLAVLEQLAAKSPFPGVWAGDLIDKTTTRQLIRDGYAQTAGRNSSSLDYVTITAAGRAALKGNET